LDDEEGRARAGDHTDSGREGLPARRVRCRRLGFADAIALMGKTDVPKNGDHVQLCTTEYWSLVSAQLCAARDTMQQADLDFHGKECNAVTTTIGFLARPAQVSNDVFAHPPRPSACDAQVDCH
jgi:hypothetical protein